MPGFKTLYSLTKEERFIIFFQKVTSLSSELSVSIMKKALLGIQDDDVMALNDAFTISEFAQKGFLGGGQAECLSNFCKVS